jgi:NitT/TauT family transport system substrate-binding protein
VSSSTSAPNKVTIAYQPGLGYFSLVIVKQQNVLEQQFPNTQFEWKALSSGSAIRDSMIANQIQVGGVGIAPFLIGWGRGVEWRLLSGLNQQDLWLVTKDPQIKSLKDFKPNQKIAVPAPDSIQAVTLRKGAQKELGDARALDANLVAMSQPDGLQALERGQVSAQLPAPPIQFQVVEHGGKAILRSSELFGGLPSGGSLVVMDSFYTQYPAFNQALYTAIENASKLMAEKPDDAAKLLAQDSEGKTTPAEAKQWITHKGVRFTTEPSGYLAYASFMQEAKMISKTPQSMEELVLPPLKGREGN